jgi:hypothetical protein
MLSIIKDVLVADFPGIYRISQKVVKVVLVELSATYNSSILSILNPKSGLTLNIKKRRKKP